ncbi:VOC family protein [Pseudonocardia sp. KRD-184]|uniref:VOC family protein n=1 Tax=Pseudonocardia oceani TaxID=2792013 RepID=A0ABS6UE66_9PSEU|nr:VOC family protein [Pseudonocardia oceani]MBW0088537.1 VOC family protein [Pseudonocardia oceani]MBW0095783.1 VOC family protein [Pseudonocardia oceani]MBW0108342.1 VOC family protein [Pseudonocardia oceani]MBW0120184.1 VOC family protein [Pseudonocardia oceani]MBW0130228.1 VOC family protein [Pseudonocardia oceani]
MTTTVPPRYEIAHLAHAELLTPDLEGSLWFFTELLGMRITARHEDSIYLRCYEDPYHHSLKLTAADHAGLGLLGWRTTSADALERRAAALDAEGLGNGWTTGDIGVGRTFAFRSPDGHAMELVWDVEKYSAPTELRSPILTRRSKRPLQGMPPRRLDHVNLMASDVTAQKEVFERTLGFGTRERVIDAANGDTEIGVWLSVNNLGHEMAVMLDQTGSRGRLHHLAFWYGVPQHNTDAAELCREYGIQIEAGPDVHGITQGAFLYVFEPGGNRIELFGNSGILQFEPDHEMVTWDISDFDTGLAIGGATLPAETYFVYGTPANAGQEKLLAPSVLR